MIVIDDSTFPFVTVTLRDNSSDDEFQTYRETMDRIRRRSEQRFVVMYDVTQASTPTARQLRLNAEWIRARAAEIRERSLGNAFVVASPGARAVLKTLFRMQASVAPYEVVETVEEGRAVLQAILRRESSRNATG